MTDLRERFPKHERIYLQEGMGDEGSTTWCQDRITDDDPEYIQIEKYNELKSLVATQADEIEFKYEIIEQQLAKIKAVESKYESLLRQVEGAEKKSLFRDCNGDLFIADSLNDNDWHILNRFWFKDIESDGDELAVALVPMPLKEGDES